MKLNAHFEAFHNSISLDQTRVERIKAAHISLREILEKDEDIKDVFFDSFLQGSYTIGTALRPKNDEEFDVDVVLVLDIIKKFGHLPDSSLVIEWLLKRIVSYEKYKGKAKARRKCVRIDYADGFHIDVLPAHEPGGRVIGIQVPPDWMISNPSGYKTWCENINAATDRKFTRVTKYLKWWRNLKLGQDSSLKSIVLTTLVGEHLTKAFSSDAEALVECMESMNRYIQDQFVVPTVWNPSLPMGMENLARDWKHSDFADFKKKLQNEVVIARAALDEEDREKSIRLWAIVLGEKFCGSVVENAKAMNTAIKQGTAVITSGSLSGVRTTRQHEIPVIPVRQYGE
jgi:hypothetical protein